MNPEPQQNINYFGNDRRTFARPPVNTLELESLEEQAFNATCQEIVDLYNMLQHKCIQGDQFHE